MATLLLGAFAMAHLQADPTKVTSPNASSAEQEKSQMVETKVMMLALIAAIKNYLVEYNRLPDVWNKNDPKAVMRTNDSLLAILTGKDRKLNPREIVFIDAAEAKEHKAGIREVNGKLVLTDSWGEPLYYMLDFDGTAELPDPASPGKKVSDSVLVFSSGADRDAKSWEDNIKSWK